MQLMETDPVKKGFRIPAAEIFKARLKHRDRFAPTPTEIPGVSTMHEPAAEISLPKRKAARLLNLAVMLRQIKAAAEAAKKRKSRRRGRSSRNT